MNNFQFPRALMVNENRGQWNIEGVKAMIREAIALSVPQVQGIADQLKTGDLRKDAERVYQFLRQHVPYKLDDPGKEQIRTAARTFADVKTRGGVDCDDLTIVASALFIAMGYTPRAYIISQGNGWSHIFPTVGDHAHPGHHSIQGYVVDAVPPLSAFDQLAPNITATMEMQFLRGLNGSTPHTSFTSIAKAHRDALLGIGGVAGVDPLEHARELRKAQALLLVSRTPEAPYIADVLGYVTDVTTDGHFLFSDDAPVEAVAEYLGEAWEIMQEEQQLGDLGAAKRKKKEAKEKLDNNAKAEKKGKAKEKIKKAANKINKFNPATIAARAGLIAALRLNLFRQAEKLSFGYLSTAEAQAAGLDARQHANAQDALKKVEGIFYTLGGDPKKLKAAIMHGQKHARGKKALDGLGAAPVLPAVAAAAAAFIAKIGDLLKKVDFKALLKNAGNKVLETALNKKVEEAPDNPADSDGALPASASETFDSSDEAAAYEAAATPGATTAAAASAAAEPVTTPAPSAAQRAAETPAPTPKEGGNNTMLYVGIAAAGALLLFINK